MVAVLFVDPGGSYAGVPGVDMWDAARDARLYPGPHPVVAHPPCNKWSPLAHINKGRLPDYRVGDDGGCFECALQAVREWGGVLEHPAGSLAWARFGLPRPVRAGWVGQLGDPGVSAEVDQGVYGHPARKRTWLYYVGDASPVFDWGTSDSDVWVSGFLHHRPGEYVPDERRRVRPREAAATPPRFRDALIALAETAIPAGQISLFS